MSSTTEITIATDADWEKIRQEKLKVVIDPMVFRTADVFLRGASAQEKAKNPPAKMWDAITRNIGSLCTFFDTLILEERLPMYDYSMTFPEDIQTGKSALVEYCNEVLIPVTVGLDAYANMKQAALESMENMPVIPQSMATDILSELTAFEWEWRPDLWGNNSEAISDQQRVLDSYRYGGVLFSGYAQRTGADHILQPKRARLYLAASLGTDRDTNERALFAKLTKLGNADSNGFQRIDSMPPTPTFLPYLLKFDDPTPRELLSRALKLRRKGVVNDYRQWRIDMIDDLSKGRVTLKRKQELAELERAIAKELNTGTENGAKITTKVGVKIAAVGPELSAELGVENEWRLAEVWGWFLQKVPGYRYRKLLQHLIIAQSEYSHIDQHLKRLWYAA